MNSKETKRAALLSRSAKLFFCVITLSFFSFFAVVDFASAKEMTQENNFLVDSSYDFYGRDSVDAFLAYESESAYFYFEHKYYDSLTSSQKAQILYQAKDLGDEFDETIYPQTRKYFGEEWNPGIDGNGKLVVLFNRLKYNVGGYFNPNDEYSKERVTSGRSNEAEMIYLNPDFLKSGKVEGFLSHELQHMIYWNQKTRIKGTIDETWINEGRSELASSIIEDVLDKDFSSQTLSTRRKNFLLNYADSIADWKNTNYDYSSVSIFMQYIKDHFSMDIFKDMNQTSKTGVSSLDSVLKTDEGTGLTDVFTNWTIANYVNDTDIGASYGYKNENLVVDFHVAPQAIYDKNKDGIINLTDELKNWSGKYYKVDISDREGDFFVDISFNGNDAGKFAMPYIVNYRNGLQKVGSLKLNYKQDGDESILFKSDTISSIVFVPSSQKIEGVISGEQVNSYGFSLDVEYEQAGSKIRPDSTLIRAETGEKTYLLENGKKRWITDVAAFVSNGYDWKNIILIDESELALYPDGENILAKAIPAGENSLVQGDGPEVYVIKNKKKCWIENALTFAAYGFEWNKITKISNEELLKYENGEMLSKNAFADGTLIRASDPKVYLIENGRKRWISSPAAFSKNNYKWSSIVQTSDKNIAFYQDGPNIE